MLKLVYKNLRILKNGSDQKKQYVDCYFNKFFMQLLIFLYKENLISNYVYISKYKLRIYLKYYKDLAIFSNLFIPDFLKKKITYKKLEYIIKRGNRLLNNRLIVILTTKGFFLITDPNLLKLRLGGEILFIINY